jgi:hypothetical protein
MRNGFNCSVCCIYAFARDDPHEILWRMKYVAPACACFRCSAHSTIRRVSVASAVILVAALWMLSCVSVTEVPSPAQVNLCSCMEALAQTDCRCFDLCKV